MCCTIVVCLCQLTAAILTNSKRFPYLLDFVVAAAVVADTVHPFVASELQLVSA